MSCASGWIPAGTAPPLAVAMSILMKGTPAPTNSAWSAMGQPRPTLVRVACGSVQPETIAIPLISTAGNQQCRAHGLSDMNDRPLFRPGLNA